VVPDRAPVDYPSLTRTADLIKVRGTQAWLAHRRAHDPDSVGKIDMPVGFLSLAVAVILILRNVDAVKISFLGARVRMSLAVALLTATAHVPLAAGATAGPAPGCMSSRSSRCERR
jgi:hypothetical protein